MTDLTDLHAAVKAMTDATANGQGILTLGGLRAALRVLPPETPVVMPNGQPPGVLDSYRGYYERLALSTGSEPTTAGELVARLDRADGATYYGYKGGEYGMDAGTFMHAAEYGCTGEAIVGIRLDGSRAVIETAEEEW